MSPAIEPVAPLELLVKDAPTRVPIAINKSGPDDDEAFSRIRCPICSWRPSASSLWYCNCVDTPEPFFQGCGTEWNTFSTRGRCPGCSHQWRWTTCLRCHESSLHQEWYEANRGPESLS